MSIKLEDYAELLEDLSPHTRDTLNATWHEATKVFSPLLVTVLVLSIVLTAMIALDGESTWLEGATLVALYAIVATAFWWG